MQSYKNDGHAATVARQKSRRALVAGKASWVSSRPAATMEVHPETRCGQPVAPRRMALAKPRRTFGEGLLRSLPTYRAPASFEDLAWYEQQNALEAEREIERRFAEYTAMDRLSRGLDPY